MNEETPKSQPEKSGIDDKRKNALLRYVAIMFAVAFLLVLLSLIGQMRDSKNTISQLSQSSSSALQKAEQLQDTNRLLEENNLLLKKDVEDLEEEVKELKAKLSKDQKEQDALVKEQETAVKEAAEAAQVEAAYELLLTLKTDRSEENLQKMKENKEYLGPVGQKTLETILTEEGE